MGALNGHHKKSFHKNTTSSQAESGLTTGILFKQPRREGGYIVQERSTPDQFNGPNTLGPPGLYLGVSIICFHDYSLIMSQAFMVYCPLLPVTGAQILFLPRETTPSCFPFFSFQTGGLNLVQNSVLSLSSEEIKTQEIL